MKGYSLGRAENCSKQKMIRDISEQCLYEGVIVPTALLKVIWGKGMEYKKR